MAHVNQPEISEVFEYFANGKYTGAELVIGLVAPVGVNLARVVTDLATPLGHYSYAVQELRVSEEVIPLLVSASKKKPSNEYSRVTKLMDAGDNARKWAESNSVLASGIAAVIYNSRKLNVNQQTMSKPRHVFIVNSLKHPDEIKLLKRIYGDGFISIGVYSSPDRRKEYLTDVKKLTEKQALALMDRDEAEDEEFGQRTRDTFQLSDFFIHLDENEDRRRNSLRRVVDLIFGHPYSTPTFDEYAMFMAFSSSLRSADLSRQVGAVVGRENEILATGANDCPRFNGGLYWPENVNGSVCDAPRGRDYKRGVDSNDEQKELLVQEILKSAKKAGLTSDFKLLEKAVRHSPVDDITEYGRVVHAEMDALLTCSRNGVSTRKATLYCTTFPCHNCAKHIIASGIHRVVYIEPYPKSKALVFHDDSAELGIPTSSDTDKTKVTFEPFVGVGPRRFFDLFSMKHGSGFPLRRKNSATGKILPWKEKDGTLRLPMLPWSYLQREEIAAAHFDTSKGKTNAKAKQSRSNPNSGE